MIVASSLTRGANTTAYDALDSVGSDPAANFSWTIDVNALTGESWIYVARAVTNKAAIVPRLRLHLYSTAPTAIADLTQNTYLWANKAYHLGHILFPAMQSSGTGSDCSFAEVERNPLAIQLATGGIQTNGPGRAAATIYGQLETLDAYTPASGQIMTIILGSSATI